MVYIIKNIYYLAIQFFWFKCPNIFLTVFINPIPNITELNQDPCMLHFWSLHNLVLCMLKLKYTKLNFTPKSTTDQYFRHQYHIFKTFCQFQDYTNIQIMMVSLSSDLLFLLLSLLLLSFFFYIHHHSDSILLLFVCDYLTNLTNHV